MKLLIWTALAIALSAASASAQRERLPLDSLHQNGMSGLHTPTAVVVRNPAEWRTWWDRVVESYVTRKPPLPSVDFSTHMVIVVGTGDHSLSEFWVSVDSAVVSKGILTVYVRDTGVGVGCIGGTGPSWPVVAVRVPRRSEPVEFKTRTRRSHCGWFGLTPPARIVPGLLAGRRVCLTLDWGEGPRGTFYGGPPPDSLTLLPNRGEHVPAMEWTDAWGRIELAPSQQDRNGGGWYWQIAGDTLAIRGDNPTMDGFAIWLVPPDERHARWKEYGLVSSENSPGGRVRLRPYKCGGLAEPAH